MSIMIETRDPDAADIREAVEDYGRRYPEYAESIDLYGAAMEAQSDALSRMECAFALSGLDVEASLRQARPLFDPSRLDINLGEFYQVLEDICAAVERHTSDRSPSWTLLLEWEGLSPERFGETREILLRGAALISGDGRENGFDTELASGMIWESLVPFYRKCAQGLRGLIDHSLWQRGCCPICGSSPLMGMFRPGDGLWLLECRLCHTLWNVRRAACPFCLKGNSGSLEYLYLDDRGAYRAYYCGTCRRYVKNVDLRNSRFKALMPIDNLVSELMGLDLAALQEGLMPA